MFKGPQVTSESPLVAWMSQTPSSTILVFNTPISYGISEIQTLFQRYGSVKSVEKIPAGDVALIDFVNLTEAHSFVTMGRTNPFFVGSNRAQLEFCSQRLMDQSEATVLSKVVRLEITDATYPITVEVLQAICSPIASPVRMLVGPTKENQTLDALIEFANNADARKARDSLNGNDIYSGCCTISCSLSGIPILLVKRNDASSWDYSNSHLLSPGSTHGGQKVGLLGVQPVGPSVGIPSAYPNVCAVQPYPTPVWRPAGQPMPLFMQQPQVDYYTLRPPPGQGPPPGLQQRFGTPFGPRFAPPPTMGNVSQISFTPEVGCTLFFNKLPPKLVNCDRLFNLCCLYGNVARIKCLKSREGVAMVQMGNAEQAQHLFTHLNNITLFDHQISLAPSKLNEIDEGGNISATMEDGSPYFKNYMNNKNNRFLSPASNKSRITPPTSTLHFFNTPPTITEDEITKMFAEADVTVPLKVVIFPIRADQKASIGLIEWSSPREATEALIFLNNHEVKVEGFKHPFHFKLAFSSKPIDEDKVLLSLHKRIAVGEEEASNGSSAAKVAKV